MATNANGSLLVSSEYSGIGCGVSAQAGAVSVWKTLTEKSFQQLDDAVRTTVREADVGLQSAFKAFGTAKEDVVRKITASPTQALKLIRMELVKLHDLQHRLLEAEAQLHGTLQERVEQLNQTLLRDCEDYLCRSNFNHDLGGENLRKMVSEAADAKLQQCNELCKQRRWHVSHECEKRSYELEQLMDEIEDEYY